MKKREDIEKRLLKLRRRYAHKYIQESQIRRPCNCIYNLEHTSDLVYRNQSFSREEEMIPNIQSTIIIMREDKPKIGLCMYGAKNPESWPGKICDSDDVAQSCPLFTPSVSVAQSKEEFLAKLADDEFVFDKYRDVATLQWVLGERVHVKQLSPWDRFTFWFLQTFVRVLRPIPVLPPEDLPVDIWDDPAK